MGPGADYELIRELPKNSALFIISLMTDNDFYNAIDIETNQEGYIWKEYVDIDQEISKSKTGIFSPKGSYSIYNPEVEIFNNTSKNMTLKLNSVPYKFTPYERRTITIKPGTYNFIASAPGVIPYYGSDYLANNMRYSWEFYIITQYK